METQEQSVILVVDDTEQNLSVVGNILEENGYELVLVTSGKEALETIQQLPPDLILLDIMMPEMDGYEVCKRLKDDPKTKDIPVIFLTAKVETDDIIKGFKLGAVDYITKPFKSEELLARVNTHLTLKKTEKELLEILQMKNKLFSIIGHDLRGPIGNLMMMMETILDENSSKSETEIKRYISMMRDSSKSAFTLLENLLNWARSQQKLDSFSPELFNISNIINENIKVLEGTAKNKNINLFSQSNPDLVGYFDKNSISTVIRNLISNALKFSNAGGDIKVSVVEKEGLLEISVKDSGIGLSEENLAKLFKKNTIFSTRGTKGEKGTGLGLLLCKDFVDGNNGKIWVESELGKGTSFHFTLPLSKT